ncbi:hypothetical protein FVEG_16363 [Fusarium verticillioides 7600]|uniref:mitogen-activated protein kinase kinase n=1 Tax=Gibberella moniliformis (strain M3125 / FGSC 7600) TaxID=334819 RepID=W7MD85_GIBM7|nr:hypothetical protein FVEG_16363 [Fusarium verticillioides 7600]EWG48941.1 hypothetical protein FVEG_16363 [Fusarium verticillioides 7600]
MGLIQLKRFDILHRDIKPGNILVRKRTQETFQIILADFGIAGKYTEQSEYFYGTAYYKAPEIFDETADVVDDRSDVWSTGIIVLEKMYRIDKIKKKGTPSPNLTLKGRNGMRSGRRK